MMFLVRHRRRRLLAPRVAQPRPFLPARCAHRAQLGLHRRQFPPAVLIHFKHTDGFTFTFIFAATSVAFFRFFWCPCPIAREARAGAQALAEVLTRIEYKNEAP